MAYNDKESGIAQFVSGVTRSLLTTALLNCYIQIILFTAWATCVTLICDRVRDLSISPTLLAVFGTILGFIISFRTSSAIERFNEGNELLTTIAYASRTFARVVWFHPLVKLPVAVKASTTGAKESTPDAEAPTPDANAILEEKRAVLRLIQAFSIAAKRRLCKKELKAEYVAKLWPEPSSPQSSDSDPEKDSVRSVSVDATPVGAGPVWSVPLKISFCLQAYIVSLQNHEVDPSTINALLAALNQLVQSYTELEKISSHPIPFSSQLWICTYMYIFFLPFQLWQSLGYVTIPGTSLAALFFLGLLAAGQEIENPVDDDRNDLNLGEFCDDIKNGLDLLTETPTLVLNPSQRMTFDKEGQLFNYLNLGVEDNRRQKSKKTWKAYFKGMRNPEPSGEISYV